MKTFPKLAWLPPEIRLMIWTFWGVENQPALRHYLCLGSLGRRDVAFDARKYEAVRNTERTATPSAQIDPGLQRIRFTNTVLPVEGVLSVWALLRDDRSGCQKPFPTSAWVDMARDMFNLEHTGYRQPGRLRFLASGIGVRDPGDLAETHWARRIQHLASHVSRKRTRLCSLDVRMLQQLEDLQTVSLILLGYSASLYPRDATDEHGFADVGDVPGTKKCNATQTYGIPTCHYSCGLAAAWQLRVDLVKWLQPHVKIRIAADRGSFSQAARSRVHSVLSRLP